MTHDELLNKIVYDDDLTKFQTRNALRAVVELHSPVSSYMFSDKVCEHCSVIDDDTEILYPCPTILAIEHELA
jgi:hypothetical protein